MNIMSLRGHGIASPVIARTQSEAKGTKQSQGRLATGCAIPEEIASPRFRGVRNDGVGLCFCDDENGGIV